MKENFSRNRLTEDIRRLLPIVIKNDLNDPIFMKHIFTLKDVRSVKGGHVVMVYFNMDFLDNKMTRNIEEKALSVLEKSKHYIISRISKSLRLKRVPELRFIIDQEREATLHIDEVIKKNR